MRMGERVIEQFSALAALQEKFPGWRVVHTQDLDAGCDEEIHRSTRLILIKTEGGCWAREWATAHALAHLDLDHPGPVFSLDQESDADLLAGLWLDVEWDDVPMDGEPTVYLRRSA